MWFNIIPFFILGYFLLFFKNNRLNNLLTGLIFVSFFAFATNYYDFGLEFSVFRYLHRIIGSLIAISLVFHVFSHRINVFKELMPRILTLFFLVLLLSFVGNDIYAPYYFHYVRNFIFVTLIVLYLYYMLDSNEKLNELFKLIIAITIILTLSIFIYQVTMGLKNHEFHRIYQTNLFFSNPNYLAYSLLPGFVLTLFSEKKYRFLFLFLIFYGMLATGSRAALVGAVFALAVDIYFKQYRKIYLVPILLTFLLITTLFFNNIIINTQTSSARYVLTFITINIFKEHPVNGIGYGQFRKKFRTYIDDDIIKMGSYEVNDTLRGYEGGFPTSIILSSMKPNQLKQQGLDLETEKMTHNDLLTIVAELGLLGIACTVFIFYKLYIELQKLLLHNKKYFFLSISLIGSSLIFSLFHNNLTSFVFWFILFIPFIINRNYMKIR